ncbi:hypothetical protein QJS10_CPA06g00396 [Acorus calamus]|uniref:Glycine-rich protein n=1 Tax=Acorus calamus TaxID=4465 RepID=A0AAV9EHJ8_ACOCL|nr:hypothetical protein QJS10_CPA06g00396 [Acorus calamus]
MVLTNFSGTGVGFGGGCGVGLGLGWGFGNAFGSHYRTTEVRFQGIEFEKGKNEVKMENEIRDGSASG